MSFEERTYDVGVCRQMVDTATQLFVNRNHIQFSAFVPDKNPGLLTQVTVDEQQSNTYYMLYGLSDPEIFFNTLIRSPQEFRFDCLSVLPVVQYLVLYKLLLKQFVKNKVLDLFENAVIQGGYSYFLLNGIKHMFMYDNYGKVEQDKVFYGFTAGIWSIFPKDFVSFQPISRLWTKGQLPIYPGYIISTANRGVRELSTYGNGSDWNGHTINIPITNNILDARVLLLSSQLRNRPQTLRQVSRGLLSQLPKHGISSLKSHEYRKYEKAGGLKLVVKSTYYFKLINMLNRYLLGG